MNSRSTACCSLHLRTMVDGAKVHGRAPKMIMAVEQLLHEERLEKLFTMSLDGWMLVLTQEGRGMGVGMKDPWWRKC